MLVPVAPSSAAARIPRPSVRTRRPLAALPVLRPQRPARVAFAGAAVLLARLAPRGKRREGQRCAQPSEGAPATGNSSGTPLWVLKATQLLIFGANVCLARYITVYYAWIGLGRGDMSKLLLVFPLSCFLGQLFWSNVVDYLGEYKRTMVATSAMSVLMVFAYLLPNVKASLSLLVLVTAAFGFFASPSGPLVDALCLKVVSEQPTGEDYGDQRLWSAVGWGSMALLAGEMVEKFGVPAMFFCYAALVGINVGIITKYLPGGGAEEKKALEAEQPEPQVNFFKVLMRFEVIWLLLNLFVYGMLMSLSEQFLNVFLLQDFVGTPEVLLGAATATMCLFEIPVFKNISKVWKSKRMGLNGVIVLMQGVLALRCVLYTLLPRNQPWSVLLVEPLHGFTFAGMWCAAVESARRLAPPGTEAKMQALLNGLFYQISMGLGAFFWGFFVPRPPQGLGFGPCFLIDAGLIVAWLAVWSAGLALFRRRAARQQREPQLA